MYVRIKITNIKVNNCCFQLKFLFKLAYSILAHNLFWALIHIYSTFKKYEVIHVIKDIYTAYIIVDNES